MDNERRGEEESTLDSQDLSSAASLERDSGSSNEESGIARRNRRQRPRKTEAESNGGGRPNVVENSSGGSRLPTTASVKENTLAEGVSKATVTVSTTGNQSNASTGHSQPREQRNRFEKANGGRKPMNDVKTRDEPLNGTAT